MSKTEINFLRLLQETQAIANSNKALDWTFEKGERRILVLYGSETGTAVEVAERIGREALRYYFHPSICALNDIAINKVALEKLAVFIVATTGQGDDPDNMKLFFKALWDSRSNRSLFKNVSFGVLGLGDSSYQRFNFASKRLHKLLSIVGGKPIIGLGLADDQHELGPDYIVDKWLAELWDRLLDLSEFTLPEGLVPLDKSVLPVSKVHAVFESSYIPDGVIGMNSKVTFAELTLNERKTSLEHFQDVRLIEFDVSSLNYIHKPGDVLMIQPQNMDEHVDEFINVLGLDPNRSFFLKPNSPNALLPETFILPQPCTVRQCVKTYFDILAVPKRYFFEMLSFFSEDMNEKEKFLEFASSEGQEEYCNYCTRPKRTILEVLSDFPLTNKNIPFDYLFDLIPCIRPRAYSIASSALLYPGKVRILMAVVKYQTILKRPRLGLCSNWLINLPLGDKVPIWIKEGSLVFPKTNGRIPPVILIGPGTGCAPFASYLQERVALGNLKNIILIFGCRGRAKDYFFREEWEKLKKEEKLELFCAFSRDQENKIYVQHVMKENYRHLWSYISNNETQIYYAGNAKRTPIDVYDALQFICQKGGRFTPEAAEQYMKNNVEKRYQTESWT